MFGYGFSHSEVDGNGFEFISFMTSPTKVDKHGLLYGKGIMIMIDNKKQKTDIYQCRWERGAPKELDHLLTMRDEVMGEAEISSVMRHLGVKIEEDNHDA